MSYTSRAEIHRNRPSQGALVTLAFLRNRGPNALVHVFIRICL